jgi:hypothetical protein
MGKSSICNGILLSYGLKHKGGAIACMGSEKLDYRVSPLKGEEVISDEVN